MNNFKLRNKKMQDNDEELRINSEIIWNFGNVDKELLSAYPNGTSLTESLITIDGLYTWEVEFFPNGKDLETLNKLYVSLKLMDIKEGLSSDVNAECNYYIINKVINFKWSFCSDLKVGKLLIEKILPIFLKSNVKVS